MPQELLCSATAQTVPKPFVRAADPHRVLTAARPEASSHHGNDDPRSTARFLEACCWLAFEEWGHRKVDLYRRALTLTRYGFPLGIERDSVLRPDRERAMAARGLAIREDVATATELRLLAKKEPRRRTAQRM